MILALMKYYLALRYWDSISEDSIKKMQLKKFRELFDLARSKSKFYREYYRKHNVLDLQIKNFDDIKRIPIVNKSILKQYPIRDIMTRDLDDRIHIHSTSGSTGEPFKIAIGKYEDYTAHVRVYWALKKAGYRSSDKIVIVTRYNPEDKFEIERDLSTMDLIQEKVGLFQREIISIFEPIDSIVQKLQKSKASVLWSTPSIMQIVCNRLKQKKIAFDFPIVFFTSEVISSRQKELFLSFLGKNIVDLYGTMESPSLGFDFGLAGRFSVLPNSNYFEFDNIAITNDGARIGNVVITNLINRTMPFIRYDLNDLVEIDSQPEFGCTFIKKVVGRQDDIITLSPDKYLAHHHVYEMFKDFHECEMYKFIQKRDHSIILQLLVPKEQEREKVEKLAHARWDKRFETIPLFVEFVNNFEINPRTGKFKNIEIEK